VKTTESGGPRGVGAGKREKSRKRRIAVGTLGLMVRAAGHPANVPDQGGAMMALRPIRTSWPWLRHAFADGGHAGPKLHNAMKGNGDWRTEIIKRSDLARGFEISPRRWAVERADPWLGRCRRLAKAWEASGSSAEARLPNAHIRILISALARFYAGLANLRGEL
jgi:putative transposase